MGDHVDIRNQLFQLLFSFEKNMYVQETNFFFVENAQMGIMRRTVQ